MKKSLSLVMVALLFVVLGCSLDRFTGGGGDDAAPTPATSDDKGSTDSTSSGSDSSSTSSSGGGGKLTMDNYGKINNGMSYDQVKAILGDGTETRSSSSGNSEYKSYKWEGDNYARIYVNFKDDKVTSKSQTNLGSKPGSGGSAAISKAKYDQVKNGMTIEEVEKIIGSKGEETSSSNIGSSTYKSYRWKGEKFSSINIRFKDDKVTSKSQYGLK